MSLWEFEFIWGYSSLTSPRLARDVRVFISLSVRNYAGLGCLRKSSTKHLTGSRGSTTTTAEATTELRSVVARSTAFLALTSITTTITALTVTSGTTTTSTTAFTTFLTTHHATRRCVRALLLDVGGWHDLSGQ